MKSKVIFNHWNLNHPKSNFFIEWREQDRLLTLSQWFLYFVLNLKVRVNRKKYYTINHVQKGITISNINLNLCCMLIYIQSNGKFKICMWLGGLHWHFFLILFSNLKSIPKSSQPNTRQFTLPLPMETSCKFSRQIGRTRISWFKSRRWKVFALSSCPART